tara:strand:+ start:2206 stop:2790 length:585 start_codon:yes stop_codon:yes gene_type:complete
MDTQLNKPNEPERYQPREGDIVFQALPLEDDLIQAIEGVTESTYSHVGVLLKRDTEWIVIEASRPGVIYTPFDEWKTKGRDGRWAAYRLKATYQDNITQFLGELQQHIGKPYDFKYELTEDKLYCSELIYHAWRSSTGEQMGELKKIGELNWKPYREVIEKYNQASVPVERQVISPIELSKADQLEKIYDHGLG